MPYLHPDGRGNRQKGVLPAMECERAEKLIQAYVRDRMPEKEMEELEERCRARVQETCGAISPLCGVAMGHAAASREDTSVEDILKRADEKMYEDKRNIKL